MKLNLDLFKKTYSILETKSLDIMEIYGYAHYDLESFEYENYNGKDIFTINCSIYYSGCGTEGHSLTFDLHEMNNDLSYFENKYKQEQLKQEQLKQEKELLEKINRNKLKEERDLLEYERLKKKFEN